MKTINNKQGEKNMKTITEANLTVSLNHFLFPKKPGQYGIYIGSLKIAEYFGKQHKDVLRAIDAFKNETFDVDSLGDIEPEVNERNFAPVDNVSEISLTPEDLTRIANSEKKDFFKANFKVSSYVDEKGETRKEYHLTRMGAMYVSIGFRGSRANLIRMRLLAAFDKAEQRVRELNRTFNGKILTQKDRLKLAEADTGMQQAKALKPIFREEVGLDRIFKEIK
jgi:phage regulator Rha-like protein